MRESRNINCELPGEAHVKIPSKKTFFTLKGIKEKAEEGKKEKKRN